MGGDGKVISIIGSLAMAANRGPGAMAANAADRGPVQDERVTMDPVDLHAMRAIEKGPAVNRAPVARTIVWADTGAPVKAGDLAVGEGIEFDLATGIARRLPIERAPDTGEE